MKLTVHEFLTIDGVVQGPGSPDEDRSGGFDKGGWVVPFTDDEFGEIVTTWFERTDAILFGRTTYDLMRGYWPQVTDPADTVAAKLNGLPKYVATSTLTAADADWAPTTVLSGDVLAQVAALKERPGGELQVHGSCGLVRSLHAAGLIDEYRLITFPVAVGAGKRLFTADGPATGFRLVESRTSGRGLGYSVLTPTPFASGAFTVVDGAEATV